jgi:ribonuclease-3
LGEEDKERILAEALEALVGAAFSARGYAAAKRFIARHIIPHTIVTKSWNPKGKLQEITQAQGQGTPRYETTEIAQGERKGFRTIVRINDAPLGAGEGKSKRESEENAAQIALAIFKQRT